VRFAGQPQEDLEAGVLPQPIGRAGRPWGGDGERVEPALFEAKLEHGPAFGWHEHRRQQAAHRTRAGLVGIGARGVRAQADGDDGDARMCGVR